MDFESVNRAAEYMIRWKETGANHSIEFARLWDRREEMLTLARGYKTFSMLNSVFISIKYQEIWLIFGSDNLRMLFSPLPNVNMPTVVGILTFMSRENFMLS